MMQSASNILGAIVLIAVGLYQWTPFKEACLSYCQTPLGFILRYGFRREAASALALGFRHGLYCIGCCWALMTLLFVAGVMISFGSPSFRHWYWPKRWCRLVGLSRDLQGLLL